MKFAFAIAATVLVLACRREEPATDTAPDPSIEAPKTTTADAPPPSTTGSGTLPPHAIVAPSTATAGLPPEQTQKTQATPLSVTDYVALGQDLYRQHCAGCHGADASGKSAVGQRVPMRDLKGKEVQALTDDQLAKAIVDGTGAMSSHAHRAKRWDIDQLTGLVAYVRSLE